MYIIIGPELNDLLQIILLGFFLIFLKRKAYYRHIYLFLFKGHVE